MRIATSSSVHPNSHDAVCEISEEIKRTIQSPSLILAYYTETQDENALNTALKQQFPRSSIIGCSSCKGTMTEKGYIGGHALSVWAVEDEQGAYGAAMCEVEPGCDVHTKAKHVLRQAIAQSGRPGELPSLIALHATTGYEETILRAIRNELGVNIPIIGGTAADEEICGNWTLLDGTRVISQGIAMAVFFPTARVSYSFHSGYAATGESAVATRVEGRTLLELDGKPAADVYSDWYREATERIIDSEDLFAQSTLNPLGRQTGEIHGMPYYTLSHPATVSSARGIEMFCNIQEGERVHFMSGTTEMLVSRAGRVVDSANEHDRNTYDPIGGIAIYCAGCMLHVREALHDVAANMSVAMHHAPFICPFTFGEQGQFLGGEIAHGNLMISTVLFHKDEL